MRAVSWWIVWDDLKWPDDDVYDKIKRRADLMKASNTDTAVIFGAHFRWDFMPIWDCLHDLMATIADELHQRDLKLIDHHSSVLVHRYSNRKEMRNVKMHSGPHLPFSPSYQAAASWEFNGHKLDDWRMIDVTTGKPVYLPAYTAEEFCFNNPDFTRSYLEYVKLLLKETKIDGLMCDDAIFFSGYSSCGCKHCKDKFQKLYGHELPEAAESSFWGNWKNPAWKNWLQMRYQSNGDFLSLVKSVLPEDFPLMSCCSGSSNAGYNCTGQDVRQFNRSCNMVHLEMCGNTPPFNDPGTSNPPVSHRLVSASHHLAAAMQKNLPCVGQGYGFTEAGANIIWAANKMLGANCWFSTLKARLGLPVSKISHLPDDAEAAAKAFTFEKEHPELFRSSINSGLGVYFSYNTRNNSFFGSTEHGYAHDYFDTLEHFFSSGLTPRTILEIPTDINSCRAIILPSALCLSDIERENIGKYIANGGTIFATGPFGLYDGNGDASPSPLLSEYGINIDFTEPQKPTDFWGKKWLFEESASCKNQKQWYELTSNFFWHPARIQEKNNTLTLSEKVRPFLGNPPLEIVNAEGWLSLLHSSSDASRTCIMHMLSAEYEVEADQKLEAQRKHRSRVNLITGVKPLNASRKVDFSLNAKFKEIKVFMPFENSEARVLEEKDTVTIYLPENCSYFIVTAKDK